MHASVYISDCFISVVIITICFHFELFNLESVPELIMSSYYSLPLCLHL